MSPTTILLYIIIPTVLATAAVIFGILWAIGGALSEGVYEYRRVEYE